MGAASLQKSMGAASLHKSMGAASLHKSKGAASLLMSMGAASLHKSMGAVSLHKPMGAASASKSVVELRPYTRVGTASRARTRYLGTSMHGVATCFDVTMRAKSTSPGCI